MPPRGDLPSVIPAKAEGRLVFVTPAKAGVQSLRRDWIPAFAGMTDGGIKEALWTRRRVLVAGAGALALLHLPARASEVQCEATFTDLADVSHMSDRGIVPYDLRDLRSWITPTKDFFVRNHMGVANLGADHRVEIAGRVKRPGAWTIGDFRKLGRVEKVVTLECAGNSVAQNEGMVSTARWAGVPLRTVLEKAELVDEKDEVVCTGADRPRLDPGAEPYARSIAVREATAREALVAWEMNGEPLTPEHGAPLRLIVPGWYGMASVKWLERIELRAEPLRGRYQTSAYTNRVETADGHHFEPVTRIALKSLLAGATSKDGGIRLVGAAWGGSGDISRVAITFDLGDTWEDVSLEPERAPDAWRLWRHDWKPAKPGSYAIASRAFDTEGGVQPLARPESLRYAPYVRNEVVARALDVRC